MKLIRLLAAVLAFAISGSGAAAESNDKLLGLWSYETTFGTPLTGELTVVRRADGWRAVVGNVKTEFKPAEDRTRIQFEFPDGKGRFRGWLNIGTPDITGQSRDYQEIQGFWIRPALTQDPRFPGGSSQAFATPMTLARTGSDTFVGVLRPLANPFTLYLSIFRNEKGELLAAFRNPEQHSHGPAMQYRVTQDGAKVEFTAGQDPASPEFRLKAKHIAATGRLHIDWEDAGGEIVLVRRTPEEAAAFFPRPPGSAPYSYREPSVVQDGWETARAGQLGLDEAAITRMVQSIIDGDPAARRPSLIHSLLVAYRGKLVVEEYFFGFDRGQPHDLRSAGKTFASVLLGAAIMDDVAITPGTKIYPLMQARGPFANPDPRKAEITLAHLLTHSAGLACDDNDDASPGNENTMQSQAAQTDWWKFTLDLPMAHDPGKRYAYCSANINLAGGALTTATETWLPELFREKVAEPLQFGEWHWNLMPNDEGYLGGGAFVRPRDLLKVGQAYLDGGRWKGRQIVTPAWIKESTAPRIKITPATTGLSADDFGNFYSEGEDALAWHLSRLGSGERRYAAFAATGNGGQLLIVVPELELAAVFTGGNYMQGGIWGRWADQLIGEYIVPSIQKGGQE